MVGDEDVICSGCVCVCVFVRCGVDRSYLGPEVSRLIHYLLARPVTITFPDRPRAEIRLVISPAGQQGDVLLFSLSLCVSVCVRRTARWARGGEKVVLKRASDCVRDSCFSPHPLLITDHKNAHVGEICMLLEWKMTVSIQATSFECSSVSLTNVCVCNSTTDKM